MGIFGRRSKKKIEEMQQKGDVKGLIKALDDDRVRDDAAKALEDFGAERVIEPLARATKEYIGKNVNIQKTAAWKVIEAFGENAIEPLIKLLGDSDSGVITIAKLALGRIGKASVEPLFATIRSKTGLIRANAVASLGKCGDPQVIEPLLSFLEDREPRVRGGAAEGLLLFVERKEYNLHSDLRAKIVDSLVKTLWEDLNIVSITAAFALSKFGGQKAYTELEKAHKKGRIPLSPEQMKSIPFG
jgi:HEAT repeat protein